MSYNLTEKERSALEKYYSDMYFFCPLCEEYHEKQRLPKASIKLFGGVKCLMRNLPMIKIRLDETFEIDNLKFEKFCYKNRIKINQAKIHIRNKMLNACEKIIKESV